MTEQRLQNGYLQNGGDNMRDVKMGLTIEEACEVHGVNCDELLEKLNTHLAAKKA